MTGWWWDVVGLAIVAFAVVDEARTTLGVASGPGPLTRLITDAVWRLARRPAADAAPVRFVGGPGVLAIAATVGTWFALLWLGWSLVFLGADDAVVSSSSGAPASVWERFYFAGYDIATLGNGGYQPSGAAFQLATMAAALSGMLLITLGVSYLTSVISAVVGKRSFASQVTGFGSTGAEVAAGLSVPGAAAVPAVVPLSSLSSALTTLGQQHRAYPLLHLFRPRTPELGTAPSVAVLLDATLVLSASADPADRLPAGLRRSVVSAVQQYVTHAPTAGGEHAPPAPAPDPAAIDRAGVQVDPEQLAVRTAECAELRYELSRRIVAAGYRWPGEERSPS